MYGEAALGETAIGEGAGGVLVGTPPFGSLAVIEVPDIFTATITAPLISSSAVADPNILVIVVELELGQIV